MAIRISPGYLPGALKAMAASQPVTSPVKPAGVDVEYPGERTGLSGVAAAGATGIAAALVGGARRQQVRRPSDPRSQHMARAAATAVKESLLSWEDLRDSVKDSDTLKRLQEEDEARAAGLAPHTDAKVRYFGDSREKPRVTLYRDHAAWCPYCQKVWLLMEEKQVDYEISKVPMRSYGDKPKEFLQKVPRGLLPAIEIDGQLMTESLDIMFRVEAVFNNPDKPMFPPDGAERARAIQLLELERNIFGAWCGYLFRPEMPFIGTNSSDFTAALQQMDDELARSSSPWFLPYSHPTIVDMQYVSHVERMVASALYYKGYDIRKEFSNIDAWLTAFEKLPYYVASKSDFYTHCMDIPPQYGTPFPNESQEALRARGLIDAKVARLPVPWNADVEPRTAEQARLPESAHRLEAAWCLMKNHQAVVKFCCRAAGQNVGDWARGNPYKSELADPYAVADEASCGAVVDALLRAVVQALLSQGGAPVKDMRGKVEADAGGKPAGGWAVPRDCLEYLRDRIGVPRDMSMPAAKILRAHLGEVCLEMTSW